jgi:hypothetical protein
MPLSLCERFENLGAILSAKGGSTEYLKEITKRRQL